MFLAANEHEYYFRSDKLFVCHFLSSIRVHSCSFVAKILSRAVQRPQTTKSVSTSSFQNDLSQIKPLIRYKAPRPIQDAQFPNLLV